MLRWLTKSGIQARLLVVSLATALIFIGIYQIRKTPIGIYPEFSPVYVEVQTEALGLSADEVEQLLTVALEQDLLNGIAFMEEIWSQSMQGLSRVICIFKPGTDPLAARQVVAERLTQAHALPNVSKPPVMLQPTSSTSRVMKIGLSSTDKDLGLIDLSVLARWDIQPYLMGIEGVANVSIWGQRKRQLQVQVDPEILRDKGVTLNEVVKTTGEALWVSPLTYLNSSTPGTGGFFDTPNQRLGVRHVLPISGPEDLANIAVTGSDLILGDIATVVENHQPLIGDAIINGSPGLLLVVEKFPWANTIAVTENIEEALEELRPGLSGVVLDTEVFQPARYAEASTENLLIGSGIGFVLIAIMLFLFFQDWRAAVASLFSIVLSMVAAAYVLYLRGTMMDMMVLAGLGLATSIIIDDTIVTIENIKRRLGQQRNKIGANTTTASIILEATLEMRSPILFATFIILLAVLPLFAFIGLTGAFLQPFATSFILAMLASLLVALMVTPAICVLLFYKPTLVQQESAAINSLRNLFNPGILHFIKRPAIAYSLLGILVLAGLALFPSLDKNAGPPALKERDLLIQWEGREGTSRVEMNRMTMKVIRELNTVSGVRNIVAHSGRAIMSDKVANVNSGEIWVNIDDDVDYDQTLMAIQETIDGYPGLRHTIQNYHQQSVRESVAPSRHLHALRVYGENQDMLRQKTEEVHAAISNIEGITNSKVHYPTMKPTLEIEVDLEAARKHEIKPGDVRRSAAILLSGIEAGSLFEGQKVFEVVVWGTPEIRSSISGVENLLISKPNGGHVRLGEVAQVRVKPNPTVIKREGVSRYMDVSFDLDGTSIDAVKADIDRSLATIDFPLEYHAALVGDYKKLNAARSNVFSYTIAGLIGIFLLFQAVFSSWRLATVVLGSLIMALAGGVLVAFFTGKGLFLGSMLGFIAVLGIAVHHIVLLVSCFKNMEFKEGKTFSVDLVIQGVQDRFPAIIMTTVLTALVFAPFAFLGYLPGLEMMHTMSLVVLGGLFTSLLLNLFVVPTLYLQFGHASETAIAEEKAIEEITLNHSVQESIFS